jgi:DNA-3-methyladenine glycosylase II
LFGRFRNLFPQRRPTPARVLATLTGGVPEERLAGVGLSRQKRAYLVDLATHFVDGRIPTRSFATMPDEAVIESLTNVKGVGRWTAEMFLIFTLNREDVWPVDDLGLADGVRREYGLAERPTKRELVAFGEQFRPYRTVATWYFWRGAGSK